MTRDEFIKMKMNAYVEPSRKGTPKGHDIGLSLAKYRAAISLMDRKSVKPLKKRFGLEASESLLRKWRTEPGFKKIGREAAEEWFQINGWGKIK